MFMHLNIGSLTFSSLHGLPFWFLLVNMAHHWSSRKGRHGGLLMVLPGQRWFSVDSKSFEIKVVGEGRKVQVVITERRRGRSS